MRGRRGRQAPIGPRDPRIPSRGKHGITAAEVAAMVEAQGGRCLGCGAAVDLSVHHAHELAERHGHTEDRGCRRCVLFMLCSGCNAALGQAGDDPVRMRRLADLHEQGLAQLMRREGLA